MAYGDNFTLALAAARRKADIQGRPLTQGETVGIAEGAASGADARAAQFRQLQLENEKLAEVRRANIANEREAEKSREASIEASKRQGIGAGIAAGASIGAYVGGPYGAVVGGVIGGVVGFASNSSFLCTEMHITLPGSIPSGGMRALDGFKQYMEREHPDETALYKATAPEAVARIRHRHKDGAAKVWEKIKPKLIDATLKCIEVGDMEAAREAYRKAAVPLIIKYVPESKPGYEALGLIDGKGVK